MLKPPVSKVKKSCSTLLIMLLMFLGTLALLVLFVYISKVVNLKAVGLNINLVISNVSLALLTLVLLEVVNLKNPGQIIPRVPFMKLLEDFDVTQLCPECETLKTIRSRHCIVCNKCVERYDHHCPWINNCVGAKNHNWFLLYLTAQYLLLLNSLALTVYSVIVYQSHSTPTEEEMQSFLYHGSWQFNKDYFYSAAGIVIGIVVLFLIPLS